MLAEKSSISWHYHKEITDAFICLEGLMVVECRAPRDEYILQPGERCEVPPMIAHHVHVLDMGVCRLVIIPGVGVYDNIEVGDTKRTRPQGSGDSILQENIG